MGHLQAIRGVLRRESERGGSGRKPALQKRECEDVCGPFWQHLRTPRFEEKVAFPEVDSCLCRITGSSFTSLRSCYLWNVSAFSLLKYTYMFYYLRLGSHLREREHSPLWMCGPCFPNTWEPPMTRLCFLSSHTTKWNCHHGYDLQVTHRLLCTLFQTPKKTTNFY